MKCGIVGLPNVGKSTIFNCLSTAKAESANYPFCTIEPNLGVVQVPDSRLDALAELVNPQKLVPTVVEIVDIAGLVKGASKGEGLGNQFLANIRECNAILHVLRCFDNDNIVHVSGGVNPIEDKEIIDLELQLKDLENVEKQLEKAKKNSRTGGSKDDLLRTDMIQRLKTYIESGENARSFERTDKEELFFNELMLITAKPVVYVCNVDEASVLTGNDYTKKVEEMASKENAQFLFLAAQIESDIAAMDSIEDRQLFLEELGLKEPGVNRLIRTAYDLLELKTYFTAGVKEVRAWTFPSGATAPQAASVIHTDFEKGFIRAEVIAYNDYITYKSESKVKEAGKMRVEGKEYIVKDGDIIHFRFNV